MMSSLFFVIEDDGGMGTGRDREEMRENGGWALGPNQTRCALQYGRHRSTGSRVRCARSVR
jgi:hypothetical protein